MNATQNLGHFPNKLRIEIQERYELAKKRGFGSVTNLRPDQWSPAEFWGWNNWRLYDIYDPNREPEAKKHGWRLSYSSVEDNYWENVKYGYCDQKKIAKLVNDASIPINYTREDLCSECRYRSYYVPNCLQNKLPNHITFSEKEIDLLRDEYRRRKEEDAGWFRGEIIKINKKNNTYKYHIKFDSKGDTIYTFNDWKSIRLLKPKDGYQGGGNGENDMIEQLKV